MKIEMTKQNLFLGMTISLQAQIPEGDKLMKKVISTTHLDLSNRFVEYWPYDKRKTLAILQIFDQSLKAIEDRCHEEVEKVSVAPPPRNSGHA